MPLTPHAVRTTLRLLALPVFLSMGLAVCGLLLERAIVPPRFFAKDNETVGSYLQTLGTIYAVLLAFVVFVVWSQFNETRQHVEHEADELLDLARTARGFKPSIATAVHRHCLRYADAVLGPEWAAMESDASANLAAGAEILDDLWATLRVIDLDTECEKAIYAEVLLRLNDLSDARARRVAASRLRIPLALWMLLQFGAVVTVGSLCLFDTPLSLLTVLTAALAGAISHVLYVIRDLDNCFAGAWSVPKTPFLDVREYVRRALPPPSPAP